jgi:poly(3-hydroxybutyrate) depolymerase
MGHAWSGGCACEPFTDAKGPDATAASWAFFERHPRP